MGSANRNGARHFRRPDHAVVLLHSHRPRLFHSQESRSPLQPDFLDAKNHFAAWTDSMKEANRRLERQIAERARIEAPIEAKLRRRVTGSFIVALLLTVFIGFLSWYNARLAADDADWVAHTYAVLDRLELTSKDLIEVETSARTFALTGQDPLRAHYETARGAVAQDEDALRHLMADNPSQQRRLDVLDARVRTALEFAEMIVAKRRQAHAVPVADEILETERLMDGVRATTQELKGAEARVVTQRPQRTKAGRRLTGFIIGVGIFVRGS